jgi:hypothetical protein
MLEIARDNLASERRLIFENIANGVPVETLMTAFRRSRLEIQKEVEFVANKIREYRFRRLSAGSVHARHMVPCGTYAEIRANRHSLLETLRKLGPESLSSPLLISRIETQKIDSDEAIEEVTHRVSNA